MRSAAPFLCRFNDDFNRLYRLGKAADERGANLPTRPQKGFVQRSA
jgi:hypothetical protein